MLQISPSPFLRLPAEVRFMIYEFLFAKSQVETRPPPPTLRIGLQAYYRILFTCRLCLREARSLFYRSTLWMFRDLLSLKIFLMQPDPDIAVIERIGILHCGEVSSSVFKPLPALKLLEIRDRNLRHFPAPLCQGTLIGSRSNRLFNSTKEALACLSKLKNEPNQSRRFNVLVHFGVGSIVSTMSVTV